MMCVWCGGSREGKRAKGGGGEEGKKLGRRGKMDTESMASAFY